MAASSVSTVVAGQLSTRKSKMSVASGENEVITIVGGATNLDQVVINNTAGSATIYVRLWALAHGSVSLGTSVPIAIIACGANETVEYGIAPAPVVETALSAQVVQTTGFSASGTAVTWAVTVTIFTHD